MYRYAMYSSALDALVKFHELDYKKIGLADFGGQRVLAEAEVKENPNMTQLQHWLEQSADDASKATTSEDGAMVLVVNMTSKCGLTPTNYPELQQLHEKCQREGLPGTHEEILELVKPYNVMFLMLEKHDVNGSSAPPFLVDRNGQPYKRYAPKDLPLSFEEDIKELLAKVPSPEKAEEETKEEAKYDE
ncbi:Glutathione peroxidase [Phytophthora infestans]|uniref:Glutathione peroxidase n=1 Tax=Phytophthora infestans TaxID=4787 RepID=A0A833S344_PHYIN|nr:Glutathione peroxidase [Phytophthora infestans]